MTTSLYPTRDFNHVLDTVKGFIAVAESEKVIGEIVNVGSNFEVSIGETAEMIAETMGVNVEVVTDDKRFRLEKSEVERLWADNTRAKQLTGWKQEYGGRAGFKRGLAKTVA